MANFISKLNSTNKIAIIAIIVPALLTIIGWQIMKSNSNNVPPKVNNTIKIEGDKNTSIGNNNGTVIINNQNANHTKTGFPKTLEEKNIVSEVLTYIQNNLVIINGQFNAYEDSLDAFESYLETPKPSNFEKALTQCKYSKQRIKDQIKIPNELPEHLRKDVQNTPIKLGELKALQQLPIIFAMSMLNDLNKLPLLIGPKSILDDSDKKQIIKICRSMHELTTKNVFYATSEVLWPINKTALKEFRSRIIPLLTGFNNVDELFNPNHDLETLLSKQDICHNKQLKLLEKYSQLVGNEYMFFQQQKQNIKDLGLTEEEHELLLSTVERCSRKALQIEAMKKKLEETRQAKQDALDRIKVDFAPKASDEPGDLWGKGLRFLYVGLYEDAIKAWQMYLQKVGESDKNAKIYVPIAINFIKQISRTGVDYGCIVVIFKPEKSIPKEVRIGDVIIAYNDQMCLNGEEFINLKNKDTSKTASLTILRQNHNGELERRNIDIDLPEPKIGVIDLTEKDRNEDCTF